MIIYRVKEEYTANPKLVGKMGMLIERSSFFITLQIEGNEYAFNLNEVEYVNTYNT